MEPRIIKGRYASAVVYVVNLDSMSEKQIQTLCDAPFVEGEDIRIMPDAHAGKGCVIGYTQTIRSGKVCPSLVGIDISCGMLCIKLGNIDIDLKRFDDIVHATIPTGTDIHETKIASFERLQELKCYNHLKYAGRLEKSPGTLGGGNHFIELDKDDEDNIYLVIHTGSRNLGSQIAEYYQNLADEVVNRGMTLSERKAEIIRTYKAEGREKEIQKALKNAEKEYKNEDNRIIDKSLAYLEGSHYDDYLHDSRIAGGYATLNRYIIGNVIIKAYFGIKESIDNYEYFETVHNYIDTDDMLIRKGAISAHEGEIVLIPISMKDGAFICKGKGNVDYNMSAPHGAGRRLSRKTAYKVLSMDEFRKEMEGIYSTCVVESTIDESPMAYKSLDDILPMLEGTCEVLKHIRPIYSFKATMPE